MSDQAHILAVDDDADLLARLAVELPAPVISDLQLPGCDGLALL